MAYLEGTLVGYEKRGRPAKHNVEFHAQVKLEVKKLIKEKAEALGISQGEVIAYWAAIEHVKIELEQRLDKMEKAQIKVVPKRRKAVG